MRKISVKHIKGLLFMSDLYNRIEHLCMDSGINITIMCKESGASRASLTDLKMGRKQSLSADTLSKISVYFGVSVDYLIGNEQKEKPDGLQTTIRPEEMRLIDQFRKLSPEMQEFIISSVESQAEKLKKAQKK